MRVVQKRLRNVEKKLARCMPPPLVSSPATSRDALRPGSLADIEMRLAQGLEPKQTQQEIEQAIANKGNPHLLLHVPTSVNHGGARVCDLSLLLQP